MITGIGHVAYCVSDMEKSLNFYCGVLGFEKAFELNRDGKPWIIYLKVCAGQFVELFYDFDGEGKNGSYKHLCLLTDDINGVVNGLAEKGYPIDSMPKQGSDLNWQCWATDPDGNRIEFMQIHPESKQARA